MIIAISAQNFFTKNPTGVDFYTREIVKNLSETCEAGDQIIVYVKNLPQDYQGEAMEFLRLQKVSFKELKFKKFFNLIGVASAISKNRPDILFCPESIVTLWSFCKIIFVVHGIESKTFPKAYSFLSRIWFELSTRFSIKRSAAILAPSQATKNDLIKYYKVNPEKIFVIRHGPMVSFKPTESISGEKKLEQILFLGRIEKRKNLGILIEAFEKICTKFSDASLILAGKNGFGAEKILARIKKSSAKDKIFLEGYVDEKEKKNLLLRSGILVLPSGAEGFGFPILEGQAAQCAVICSDLEVLKEVAGDGALFFKRDDSNDLAQKLWDVMADNEMRSRLVSNGTKNLERFSWKESAQKTYNVIKSINGKD